MKRGLSLARPHLRGRRVPAQPGCGLDPRGSPGTHPGSSQTRPAPDAPKANR